MDAALRGKMERHFLNSRDFLWGLSRESPQVTYPWLLSKGQSLWGASFHFEESSNEAVRAQLLHNPGIERVLRDFVIPEVRIQYHGDALDYLRECWRQGRCPDEFALRQMNVRHVEPFLRMDRTSEGWLNPVWDIFAGLWFEELEHLDD